MITDDSKIKISKGYDKLLMKESTKGVRRKLQVLDDTIDDYMDMIKSEIDKLEENPVYQRNMYQLLADTTKEHSEFLMALKRTAASLDSGSMVMPKAKPFAKPNQQNFDQEDGEEEQEMESVNEKNPDDELTLRIMTMDDAMDNTKIHNLKIVSKGTFQELQEWSKKKKLVWKDSPKQMFGGYWYDKKTGEAYLPV